MDYVLIVLQSLFLLIITPLFVGILKRMKAFIRGYQGAKITQPYYDIKRLFNKGMVVSNSSSFVSIFGPSICLAFSIVISLLVPVFYTNNIINFGNVFLVIFMLAVIKIITTLIGLDCASTFGGMGSSRESFISLFAEPVMLLTLSVLYFESNNFNVFKISYAISNTDITVAHILALASFFILVLAENARMPVDNPETHLELTMVHEAMILDISGRNLAFIELASSIKFIVFATLLINLFLPFGIATSISIYSIFISIVIYILKMIVVLFVIAIIRTSIAKFRLFKVPELLASAFSLSIISIAMLYFNL
ncbi:NADH-quinone oxidoreductase subunit H [Caloramator sp. mosi_1]|uniref:respiratory chain complex I subunit 1 family protein n=1 Tax=Caloramator sp. mosi_1 TaxID=3023090 RepID=UPI002362166B|nr:NADH-quinone oxidoreductase subunit H [Caloramator sp. mosi_1]WDC85176.1 NADH-quinone oxidoreductase subunit H [Caloramator sp. mosi_1]